ncbi:MAG TPA: hypothetical protein VLF66_05705, partial [Thermoanaerobaculia bacterium]|nr:hypothetical protein [Thermoanaerobaculia bacterium]
MHALATPSRRALSGLALLALLAVPAWAGEDAPTGPVAEPAAPTAIDDGYIPVTVAGMQVAIDPETGELRTPTPAERSALAEAFQNAFGPNRLARKAVVHRDASGMLAMQLGFEHLDSYVAEILP